MGQINILKRIIPHKHKFIPIRYGLLTILVDEKGRKINPIDYWEGGCVVRKEKYICKICGKMII